MTRLTVAGLAILAVALAMATTTAAGDKASPGQIREGALDEIDLTTAAAPGRAPVVLRRFAADKADLGSAKEGDNQQRKDAVRFIQTEGPRMLAEALVADLRKGGVIPSVSESDQPAPEGALVLEGEFEKIDPGSKAKRYWAGFGAGKSGITVTGRVLDSKGTVLATFRHTKNSGVGLAGGDYVKFLSDDTRDVGHDLAQFLTVWQSGGDLSKEAD